MPLRKFLLVTTCKYLVFIWYLYLVSIFSLRTVWSLRPCVISIKHIKVLEENLRITHDAAACGSSKGRRSIRALFSNSRTVLCSQRKKWSMYISLAPYDDRRGTKWLMARCRNRGTIDVTFRDASFYEHVFRPNDLLWHFQHFFLPFLRLLMSPPPSVVSFCSQTSSESQTYCDSAYIITKSPSVRQFMRHRRANKSRRCHLRWWAFNDGGQTITLLVTTNSERKLRMKYFNCVQQVLTLALWVCKCVFVCALLLATYWVRKYAFY